MMRYDKLFDLLKRNNMQKSDLREILSSKTVAKLSKGENLTTEVIEKICAFLHCQPGDIMEYVSAEETREKALELDEQFHGAISALINQGYTKEQLLELANQFSSQFMESLLAGNNATFDALNKAFETSINGTELSNN